MKGEESGMVLGDTFHRRVARQVGERLTELGKNAMLIFDPMSIRYVSGLSFVASDCPLAACVWADGSSALFVPHFEAEHLAGGWISDIRWYAEYPATESPIRWMAREASGPLLVDTCAAAHWRDIVAEDEEAELSDLLDELRAVKTADEIALIELAADYGDLALERTFARLTTGSSERDVLADILSTVDGIMRQELGDQYDYPGPAIAGSIVSGTRAALPAAPTSDRRLTRGDSVVIEFTTNVGGYHAQAGGTFFVGDPLRDIVHWVEASVVAQDAAVEALGPGVTTNAVDIAAQRALERLGMAQNIRHRTGHGIGLSCREAPWLTRSLQTGLQAGMVVVVRPGVYIPGRTGARNSKTVLIEEEGSRVLNPRIDRWAKMEARLKEF